MKRTVVIGLLGTRLDYGSKPDRWDRWRPTVSIGQHADLVVSRLELVITDDHARLAAQVSQDFRQVSPDTAVRVHEVPITDPWDFESTFAALHDFARSYPFDPETEDYLVHITTGTHVAQIVLFLLTESRHIPARLLQTGPDGGTPAGALRIIDLDLTRYDRLASRFQAETDTALSFLKAGIETRNAAFNQLIERIEHVALHSRAPMLLLGPTGAGKSQLASRIYQLKKDRRLVDGPFVEVNCATVRGEAASSALFGHVKGAYTGATSDRAGLLRAANHGMLFLDEIGELGPDEQAMLLRAIEEKRFLPLGSDREVSSDFLLLAGTNRELTADVATGRFRGDLLARIDLWTFRLPSLRDRLEDLEPNLDYELVQFARKNAAQVRFSREARAAYLDFATGPEAAWPANFRDLNASVQRMATFAMGGRITEAIVAEEIERLRGRSSVVDDGDAARLVPGWTEIDRFDRAQLQDVISVCRRSRTISEAGRVLFSASRARRSTVNDADRLRKYLARFGLTFERITGKSC